MISPKNPITLLRLLPVLLLFGAMPDGLSAQEVLIGDENAPGRTMRKANPVGNQPQAMIVLTLPFFDDFSGQANLPSNLLWNADTSVNNQVPYISISKSVHPPSKGVLTFDGAGVDNRYYDPEAGSGEADQLESQPIDLSALSTANNVWLSFFVEPGGLGDKPEATDSLVLFFDTTGAGDYTRVWGVKGDSLVSNAFTQIMIELDQANYFHAGFRFVFQAFGSLNGELDQWHLDYVYLNSNRNANDTTYNDVSVINFDRGILGGYTAIPADHYTSPRMTGFSVQTQNLQNANVNTDLRVHMSDPVGGNVFAGDLGDTNTLSFSAGATLMDAMGPFSDQTFTTDGVMRFTSIIDPAGADQRNGNDTLIIDYGIDSVYALDDGIADIGYGLTVARSFCQEFSVEEPDTLTALWIRFVPSVYFNTVSTEMDGKAFYLSVWEQLIPDSAIVQQLSGSNVIYSNEFNGYVRYRLLSPQIVDSTFYVGLEQYDHMPIGIGFDKNYVNTSKIFFEDSNGQFTNTTQQGTLMIRPEFGTAIIVDRGEATHLFAPGFTVYPSPATGEKVFLNAGHPQDLRNLNLALMDVQGRCLLTLQKNQPSFPMELSLPDYLPAGMYFLNLSGETRNGQPCYETVKLVMSSKL